MVTEVVAGVYVTEVITGTFDGLVDVFIVLGKLLEVIFSQRKEQSVLHLIP